MSDSPFGTGVRVYDGALPDGLFRRILSWLPGRGTRGDYDLAQGRTYWFPFGRSPRSPVERAALALRQTVRPGPSCIGVEWWIQMRRPAEGMTLHFDKDEGLFQKGKLRHPALASVLYTSDVGTPTIVLEQRSGKRFGTLVPRTPARGALVQPKRNRYLVFDGSLLHGVTANEAARASEVRRVTVLLNWWNERPAPSHCVEPPDEIVGKTRSSVDARRRPTRGEPQWISGDELREMFA